MDATSSYALSLTGRLLIATPAMGDTRFEKAVIYICAHDPSHAMGLVINKTRGDLQVSDLLEKVGIEGSVKIADAPVLEGGPVDLNRGFVLHSADYKSEGESLELTDTLCLSTTKDILESLVTDQAPEHAMIAVGYAGWSPGQIEDELKRNAWIVIDADESLIFDPDMDGKWEKALAQIDITPAQLSRQGGSA